MELILVTNKKAWKHIPEITSAKQREGWTMDKNSVNSMPLNGNVEEPSQVSDAHTRAKIQKHNIKTT